MKSIHFKRLIVYVALNLFLLAGISVPAAASIEVVNFTKIEFPPQTVEIQRTDGSVSSARFLSEIILLQDGRANGGFGIWEQGSADGLSLYRIVEGKKNGSRFTFKAQRLSPLPTLEITVTFAPAPGPSPTGSVKFTIDGNVANGSPASLTANGIVNQGSGSIGLLDAYFSFVFINAPLQTVPIASVTDIYISTFETVGLVFPNVGAIGFLRMNTSAGEPVESFYGTGVYKTIDGGRTWMLAATAENSLVPGETIMIMIRPEPDPSEPCRIYDILGTQVNSHLHFEAETLVTNFTIGER
jgi:hypothetical protein